MSFETWTEAKCNVLTAGVGYGVGVAVDGFFFLHATRLKLHRAEAEEGVGFVDFSLHVCQLTEEQGLSCSRGQGEAEAVDVRGFGADLLHEAL